MASAPPEIRAIYWDIGGVLLTNGWDHQERARVLQQFSIPRDEYEAHHAEANDRWERGELTDDEFLKQTVFFKERSFTPAQFLQALREQSQVAAGRREERHRRSPQEQRAEDGDAEQRVRPAERLPH